ncbi:unnamed protein product [Polarella glacialis]|uniref:Biotin-protein ligase N-terminal domain-containing protein n=1 Tax=Polarella glacialis TaxID=89957 RepID=A0A813LP42_POLGL|nr:unnamed protein product [Polarella glacialis]
MLWLDGLATPWSPSRILCPKGAIHPYMSQRPLLVGLASGYGCDPHCVECTRKLLEDDPQFECQLVGISAIRDGVLSSLGLDVLIVGGGDDDDGPVYGRGQRSGLGKDGRQAIRTQVAEGLVYVGICAGAYLASKKQDSLGLCEVDIFTDSDKEVFACGITGAVELEVCTGIDPRAEAAAAALMQARLPHTEGPLLRFDDSAVFVIHGDEAAHSGVCVLARYQKPLTNIHFSSPAGNATYCKYQASMAGKPAVVLSAFGLGPVLLLGPHPELHPVLPGKPASITLLSSLLRFLCDFDASGSSVSLGTGLQPTPEQVMEVRPAVPHGLELCIPIMYYALACHSGQGRACSYY